MYSFLKSLANYNPIGAEYYENEINNSLIVAAGVDLHTLRSAINIVKFDGWFGPYTDQDYTEEGHRITKAQAFEIIEKARAVTFSDIEFDNPEYPSVCDCEEECNHTNCVIEGSTIYNELWKWYREIYG